MKEEVFKDIDRLSLHDSHIDKIQRSQDSLILTIDWAKLDDYAEQNIDEGIIIGKCELIFNHINNEVLRLDYSGVVGHEDKQSVEIDYNVELFNNWLVLQNKLSDSNMFCLGGLIDYKDSSVWLDWQFSFGDFSLTWDNYITCIDWKSGKIVI